MISQKENQFPIEQIQELNIIDGGCAGGIDPLFKVLTENLKTKYFGFEASLSEFKKLKSLQTKDVKFFNIALHNKNGILDFHANSTVGSLFKRKDREKIYDEKFNIQKVQAYKLSDLLKRKLKVPLDILKLDIEGNELNLLKNIKKNLKDSTMLIKTECSFNSLKNTNNFGEIHLFLQSVGFRLIDITYSHGTFLGINSGDLLYLKKPEAVKKNNNIKNKKQYFLKLISICYYLKLYENCLLYLSFSKEFFGEKSISLENLLYSKVYIPSILPNFSNRLGFLFMTLSKLFFGNKWAKKSIPKTNRLGRIKYLFMNTRINFIKNYNKKIIDEKIKKYKIMLDN